MPAARASRRAVVPYVLHAPHAPHARESDFG